MPSGLLWFGIDPNDPYVYVYIKLARTISVRVMLRKAAAQMSSHGPAVQGFGQDEAKVTVGPTVPAGSGAPM